MYNKMELNVFAGTIIEVLVLFMMTFINLKCVTVKFEIIELFLLLRKTRHGYNH